MLIQDVEFIHSDFQESIKAIQAGDFVYMDPPYVPLNPNAFVGDVRNGFCKKRHQALFDEIQRLDGSVKFVMSNSETPMVKNAFQQYNIEIIVTRRSINSKKPQSTTLEVIVWN